MIWFVLIPFYVACLAFSLWNMIHARRLYRHSLEGARISTMFDVLDGKRVMLDMLLKRRESFTPEVQAEISAQVEQYVADCEAACAAHDAWKARLP